MARYSRKRTSGRKSYSRSGSGYGRKSYGGGRSNTVRRAGAGRAQRVEVVLRHVMQADHSPAGYTPGVPGMVGVANVPPVKKGKTF